MRSVRLSDIQIQYKKSNRKSNNNNNNSSSSNTTHFIEECGCYGKLHAVYATCIHCGRIICESEQEIVDVNKCCLYCNANISILKDETDEIIPIGINDDEEVAHYLQAIEKRERLLYYSKNVSSRMRVIDEELDWYSEYENPWNTKEERMLALKMSNENSENMLKRKTMVNIDLENQKIVIDEGYQNRSTGYYSQLLDEFERRNAVEDETIDNNEKASNILNILEDRLKFDNKSEINTYLFELSNKSSFFSMPITDNFSLDENLV